MRIFILFLIIFFAFTVQAQSLKRDFNLKQGSLIEITNLYGRVQVSAGETLENKALVAVESNKTVIENDIKFENANGNLKIEVVPQNQSDRIDLIIEIPLRARVRIKTDEGEVRVSGDLESAEIETRTGTIAADVPLDNVKYDFVWTESRPRFLSDYALEKVKEKAAGKFVINGKINDEEAEAKRKLKEEITAEDDLPDAENKENGENKKSGKKIKRQKAKDNSQIKLNFTTARGIILLNVNPNEVPSDLRQKPLTEAAKAIIRSGDSLLTEAIRRASPKYFGDYAKTLPPFKKSPVLGESVKQQNAVISKVKKVLVRVTDINNRAVSDLTAKDFEVTESGEKREILSVTPATAPFNLILLLDVSGSVDNYVDFIRKAARSFIETANPNDKIAVIIFNEDVKELSTFTTDHQKLSESLDTFDAGGGTAFYDALAYTLTETLRPLKGERTAIVALTDGDDNRSFLPFDALLGSIQESGALVYPLYVPSGLIATSKSAYQNGQIDPLRAKYMSLTAKAEGEGEKLAQISGGVYYPIRQLSEIQKAYNDIVVQLRTAYSITFRSDLPDARDNRASPRLKIKVDRENTFVKLGSVVEVASKESSKNEKWKTENGKFEINNYQLSIINYPFFQNASFDQTNQVTGEIETIKYKQFVNDNLRVFQLENFDVNKSSGAFLLDNEKEKIAVSRWISPKRTRSYPYERVYDTLAFDGKKVALIPVVKDEGLGGERDFLQWDTISLLSLLNVHIVPVYYSDATKNTKRNDQITAQKLDKDYVSTKLAEIFNFQGTAREWNEGQSNKLRTVFEKARDAYREISKATKTYLHDETALNELIKLAATPSDFAAFSRGKSQKGQNRELQSIQPKEALSTDTKGGVTITNLAGGKYFFTCDETRVEDKTLYLIEDKHSQRAVMPSENDIKDGLIKMIIYTNLKNVRADKNPVRAKAVLKLTSVKLTGSINSDMSEEEISKFYETNKLETSRQNLIRKLFQEARENKFTIIVEHGETAK